MKKQKMVYGEKDLEEKHTGKILYAGKSKGFNYYVLNNAGHHPCGYVEVTGTCFDECVEFNKLKKQGRLNFWKRNRKKRNDAYAALHVVHGGITYSSGRLFGVYMPELLEDRSRWFVGWDYAHYGDKVWYKPESSASPFLDGKEWTTDEVIEDCKKCINALSKVCKISLSNNV